MQPVIFFRGSQAEEIEFSAAQRYFDVVEYRTAIPKNSLVIPRYSALPFYQELEQDVQNLGSKLINSYAEHMYIADIRNYYQDLKDLTFPTYTEWYNLPSGYSYVVKGITNSRKHNWNSQMFAKTKKDIPDIVRALMCDELIAQQGVVVRRYVPLYNLGKGINGLPISHEWRLFFLNQKFLAGGFYWASHPEFCPTLTCEGMVPRLALECAEKTIDLMSVKVPFVVVDVAYTARGEWMVVELNDGQMSGLSMIDPWIFYGLLKERL